MSLRVGICVSAYVGIRVRPHKLACINFFGSVVEYNSWRMGLVNCLEVGSLCKRAQLKPNFALNCFKRVGELVMIFLTPSRYNLL